MREEADQMFERGKAVGPCCHRLDLGRPCSFKRTSEREMREEADERFERGKYVGPCCHRLDLARPCSFKCSMHTSKSIYIF